MPRNAQGQYFLPDGNPVTPGELIKAEWANSTMDDLANALTNSLDRAGAGGMTGQFKAASGTESRPGISFTEDNTSGLFKEANGVVSAVSSSKKQAYWSQNGFFLVSDPADKMEAATKQYVDMIGSQVTSIVGVFGLSKLPSQLPANGFIPKDWDAYNQPAVDTQMKVGQAMVYEPADKADPLYNNVFVYVGGSSNPSGWVNIGLARGPKGSQGDTGPVGPEGPQGPQGQQGAAGPAGRSVVIVGAFGKTKTPAQLPTDGFIPKDWDGPGSPAADYQMKPGDALAYTECLNTNPLYGHIYEYVGVHTGFDADGWIDVGNIQGPAGPQGPQGPQGQIGPQGPQGPQGNPGSDATVTAASIKAALGYTPPSPTGTGASGNWGISITGNAATATDANHAAAADTATNAGHATNADKATNADHAAAADAAGQAASGNWVINFANDRVQFLYKGAVVAIIDSAGNMTCKGNVTAYGVL